MITPGSSDSGDSDHGFQIAPMVDVVFVLLLFFMALAALRPMEERLPATLPSSGSGDAPPLVIDITEKGAVLCNGLELAKSGEADVPGLQSWLKNYASIETDATVVIRPAPGTEHGRFIQVLASLHGVGLKKISFS
jgi:biopolymer transport protein ExbD